ncbi:MAG: formate dehydrogenase accessory sulfurtransferase FdhD [Actinobacteria bacterium]|nr:formate dehydrogenase accessory sulfurtransferase FdhD [Actinomycetota bacterium]
MRRRPRVGGHASAATRRRRRAPPRASRRSVASVSRRGRSETVLVRRVDASGSQRGPDELAVEEPLEIRLDGNLVGTTMRTPGHDHELAAGLCHGDGLLAGAVVRRVRYCMPGGSCAPRLAGRGPGPPPPADLAPDAARFNVVDVETGGAAPVPVPRVGTTTSSCGLCGSTSIDELRARLAPLPPVEPFPLGVLVGVAERVRPDQELFAATGAVHAAAAFDRAGEPLVVREDIGRHNAVDKVVGRLLLDGRLPPGGDLGLYVSGRASFEIVQKAWAAGFAAVVAVSAPSALAVEAARTAGLTLAGFVRGGRLNLYSPG